MGATSLGQQTYLLNLLKTFSMHFTLLKKKIVGFFSFLCPLSFGCSDFLYTCGMVCLIHAFICQLIFFSLYCVHVSGFWAKSMGPLSFGSFFFKKKFIVYMHLSLGQEAQSF
jgi:hypothetical protein